jgi:hypothetical protein
MLVFEDFVANLFGGVPFDRPPIEASQVIVLFAPHAQVTAVGSVNYPLTVDLYPGMAVLDAFYGSLTNDVCMDQDAKLVVSSVKDDSIGDELSRCLVAVTRR